MTESLTQAEIERDAARARVTQTLGELQDRLNPRTLARNAARDLTEAGSVIADKGAHTLKRNPGAVAGATAVAGLFLARHRIAGLFRRRSRDQIDPDGIL
ncbi:DUF3618 domain-containing protein [Sphingomonas ginsenosidivorax]|uniref:DUF3618 domain-containing protein n=1 Tax=Sphingomonas ginsenosidivorax TaxID=862135 RepID=A0A5C6UEJ3_9SPHN|nr:DUF3618 domain-containing protein [Sphingomonas ginsenosidivorax]TXC71119.1 DUF3618 domain-containing protein [Sphingomonas ginsenosidivorax]